MNTLTSAATQPPQGGRSVQGSQWLLALATSTEICALALSASTEGKPLVVQAASGAAASEAVLGLIDQLMAQAGIGRGSLAAVVFDCGPGAFTGVRLGCAVAQGLAYALDLPVVPVSSLEAVVAQGLPRPQKKTLAWAAIDARMGEVYCAPFIVGADGIAEPLAPPRVLPALAAVQWMAGDGPAADGPLWTAAASPEAQHVLLGNGFERFPDLRDWGRDQGLLMLPEAWPSASAVLLCGFRHWYAGHGVAASLAEPLYVRDKVALDISEQRRQV